MTSFGATYIWELPDWPRLSYDIERVNGPLLEVVHHQGRLLGRLADADDAAQEQASLAAMTSDVVKTSEIEGELLNAASVRSSVARHLGVDIGAVAPVDQHTDGVVEMVLDATIEHGRNVTEDRLFEWHVGLFPEPRSRTSPIRVGAWRTDETGPMQVVSGAYGHQRVHFEAPPAGQLHDEMARFLDWFNADTGEPAIIKAGLAHLWFVTVHPFDDGNGRIARALGDFWLARADGRSRRFYSLSAQIQRERSDYYTVLERTQKGALDVTDWLMWFLDALQHAIEGADAAIDTVLVKARFWRRWGQVEMNARQITMLNRLLDGFKGKLTTRKWAITTKSSQDTALRDINELVELGALRRSESGGRSTSYELIGES